MKLNKLIRILIFLFILFISVTFQSFICLTSNDSSYGNDFEWSTITESISSDFETDKKNLIYLYTDWCVPCKSLEKMLTKDVEIKEYILTHFNPIKFNAQSKQIIQLDGETLHFNSKLMKPGFHEYAMQITNGRMIFPSLVFFAADLKGSQAVSGLPTKDDLMALLKYYGEDYYKVLTWPVFQSQIMCKE